MSFVIGLLMLVLVLVCLALILLVLIQLPKKEAGIGVAFGGGATDALFGAGSGNVLTKATKWFAVTFFVLALLIGFLQSRFGEKGRASSITEMIEEQSQNQPAAPAPAPMTPQPAGAIPGAPAATAPATTTPVAPATETPAAK